MKFGIRLIVNVIFRARQPMTIGNSTFAVGQPVFYLDSAKTSTLEGTANSVYATGGRGNSRIMTWEGLKTLTFTVEDALLSPISFAMLSGAGLIKGDSESENDLHFHQTARAIIDSQGKIDLTDELNENETIASDAPIYIIETDETGNLTETKFKGFTVTGKMLTWTKPQDDEDAEAPSGSVFVDYYVLKKADKVSELQIDAENFAGSYYIEADTLFRTQEGKDLPANITIPNAKIQSNFTFTMAPTGDPSTFTFVMDASPAYTYFDKTKKVLCAIQVAEDVKSSNSNSKSVFGNNVFSLMAYGGDKSITLFWLPTDDMIKEYKIKYWVINEQGTEETEQETQLVIKNVLSYTLTGLTPDTEYKIRVYYSDGNNGWVTGGEEFLVRARTDEDYLVLRAEGTKEVVEVVVEGKQTEREEYKIELTWNKIINATNYKIYEVNGEQEEELKDIGNPQDVEDEKTITITGLKFNTDYTYHVCAYKENNEKIPDKEKKGYATATTPLPFYPILTAEGGAKLIILTWTAVEEATRYGVYKHNGTKYVRVNLDVTDTTYTVNGLEDDTKYSFLVLSYTTKWRHGDESYASAVTLTTNSEGANSQNSGTPSKFALLMQAVAPVTSPTVTATGGDNSVTLTWTTVPEATDYEIYQQREDGVYASTGVFIPDTEYTFTDLEDNTEYSFYVQAYKGDQWLPVESRSYVTVTTL